MCIRDRPPTTAAGGAPVVQIAAHGMRGGCRVPPRRSELPPAFEDECHGEDQQGERHQTARDQAEPDEKKVQDPLHDHASIFYITSVIQNNLSQP